VPGVWESDENPMKQVTRDMAALTNTLNREMLPKIANLKSRRPFVTCATCHRGATRPATDL
jgi:hypothetical protein